MRDLEQDRLKIEATRALADVREAEERMAGGERELERELDAFDADVDRAREEAR
jgi:hypothetical protein